MKSRKISKKELSKVLGYGEYVMLLFLSIFVNIKLAVGILAATPLLLPIVLGLNFKCTAIFDETDDEKTKELQITKFCA